MAPTDLESVAVRSPHDLRQASSHRPIVFLILSSWPVVNQESTTRYSPESNALIISGNFAFGEHPQTTIHFEREKWAFIEWTSIDSHATFLLTDWQTVLYFNERDQ